MEKRKIFLSRFETNFFPSSQFIPVGRRLTVAGGASCKIPSGDNRTPHVHNPSSSYKIFLNLTEQSWSASLFGLNFLTNRGSWLEFEAFQDHSHCTTGLFTRHLRSTDSPDATWIPLDNCTNSTVKENQRPFLSFLTKYFTTSYIHVYINCKQKWDKNLNFDPYPSSLTFRNKKSYGIRLREGGIRIDSGTACPISFLLGQHVLELNTAICAVVAESWESLHLEVPRLRLVQLPPGPLAFTDRWFHLAHYLRRGSCWDLDDIIKLRKYDQGT